MAPCLSSGLPTRRARKAVAILAAFALSAAFLVLLGNLSPSSRPVPVLPTPKVRSCEANDRAGVAEVWKAAKTKYEGLMDDKFTMVMSTYRRPKELDITLKALLEPIIPSLHEVVIVWNDLEATPPKDFVSAHGVSVRYRKSPRNSLNEKLRPDPGYRTKAILLSDDDVFYRASDLDFAFQAWRKFGQNRMTGALARCASLGPEGGWDYNFCEKGKGGDESVYSLILTNLAFTHISFMEYYHSDAAPALKIRNYVDEIFNCEDIALNFVASMLSGEGPLLVRGSKQYINLEPPAGISRKTGHMEARSKCIDTFAAAFECMPLVDETARIERGVMHNVWYKTAWDKWTL